MRFSIYEKDPAGYKALLGWNEHLSAGPLEASLRALVDLRVSQINGCAFCLAMHADDAREAGVEQRKIDTVAAWREVQAFTARERAALGLAEAMSRVSDGGRVDEATWDAARAEFDDASLATLLQAIAIINTFNRLNVATERPAESYDAYRRAMGRS